MRQIIIASAAAALLAALPGCGGGAPQGNEQAQGVKHIAVRNRPHEELMALSDELRRVGLVRAIRDTRNRCPNRVEPNPVHQGDYRGMALWTARCDDNQQYAIFIAPSGDVEVRKCEDMARLGLPACRALPAAEPRAPNRPRPRPKAR